MSEIDGPKVLEDGWLLVEIALALAAVRSGLNKLAVELEFKLWMWADVGVEGPRKLLEEVVLRGEDRPRAGLEEFGPAKG